MRELFDRVRARYPRVAQRCLEVAAIRLAEEVVRLKNGQSHRVGEEDRLSGLAQALRESGLDLSEMANRCGVELIELQRKLALSRLSELLQPGEIWELSDPVLEAKLQQAAAEYSLGIEELLDEPPRPAAMNPCVVETFALNSIADRMPHSPRCRMCRWLRPRPFKIDFKPYVMLGGFVLPREPSYACDRCIRAYLADCQVEQIERLKQSEIPKSSNLRSWSAAVAATAIVVLSSLHAFRSGAMQAAQLLEQGVSQSKVARRLNAHWQSVNRWMRQIEQDTSTGLRQADQAGRRSRLNDSQLKKLKRGPEAAGYVGGSWTASRMYSLIEELCRISYHKGAHAWRTLRTLGWSYQRSIEWELEREEDAIESGRRLSGGGLRKKSSAKKLTSSSKR